MIYDYNITNSKVMDVGSMEKLNQLFYYLQDITESEQIDGDKSYKQGYVDSAINTLSYLTTLMGEPSMEETLAALETIPRDTLRNVGRKLDEAIVLSMLSEQHHQCNVLFDDERPEHLMTIAQYINKKMSMRAMFIQSYDTDDSLHGIALSWKGC